MASRGQHDWLQKKFKLALNRFKMCIGLYHSFKFISEWHMIVFKIPILCKNKMKDKARSSVGLDYLVID